MMAVGKLSPAQVGIAYGNIDPRVEQVRVQARSASQPVPATQVVALGDRHAEMIYVTAAIGTSMRDVRPRDPSPPAHRGARSTSSPSKYRRAEGLVGDAAQAQPNQERAAVRACACAARQRDARARERRAVARARHLAQQRRAGDLRRLVAARALRARRRCHH